MRFPRPALSMLALAMLCGAQGCVLRARTSMETTPIQASVQLRPPEAPTELRVQAAPPPLGVTLTPVQCTPGASEACNGLDDNCDGRIDEGCGWESGAIQVTIRWESGADIDLYVTDPFGEVISYQRRQSSSGGVLDHDARGACVPGSDMIENVYWVSPNPPRGTYQVELHYWGECGVARETPTQISVSVGGRVIGVYGVTLAPRQRMPVVSFTL